MSRRTIALSAAMAAMAIGVASCSTSPRLASAPGPDGGKTVTVGASINAWGSILSQLGGRHVQETSIITNPNTDPHDYEPTPADGRTIATSQLFVENGIGYDPWAAKALQAGADPHRVVVDVGRVTGIPEGGNPHRWYSPTDVAKVAATITADLKKVDPADATYFQGRYRTFQTTALAPYHRLIRDIKARYAGTPVGASESIFAPLAGALGLRLVTPPSFLKAISEGTDPSAADKATIDAQIAAKKIKVYVFNSQNSTPDVSEQVSAARKAGIPVTQITETLSPAGATFQQWQATQLRSLERALAQASGT